MSFLRIAGWLCLVALMMTTVGGCRAVVSEDPLIVRSNASELELAGLWIAEAEADYTGPPELILLERISRGSESEWLLYWPSFSGGEELRAYGSQLRTISKPRAPQIDRHGVSWLVKARIRAVAGEEGRLAVQARYRHERSRFEGEYDGILIYLYILVDKRGDSLDLVTTFQEAAEIMRLVKHPVFQENKNRWNYASSGIGSQGPFGLEDRFIKRERDRLVDALLTFEVRDDDDFYDPVSLRRLEPGPELDEKTRAFVDWVEEAGKADE